MKYLFLAFLLSCTSFQQKSPEASISGTGLNVKKYTLKNGLKIILHENKKLPIVSYYTFYNIGGRFEGKGVTGATHFLEHLMFEGTRKNPRGVFDKMIEESGGNANAYTSSDRTVYYQNFPSSALKKVIEIEADRMQGLFLNDHSFINEKKAVLEEKKMRYENSPEGKLFLNWRANVYKGTPYESPVIGYTEDVTAMTKESIMDFYRSYYAPNNASIVMVGDFNADIVLRDLAKEYESMPCNDKVKLLHDLRNQDALYQRPEFKKMYIPLRGANTVPIVAFGWQGWASGTSEALATDMLSSIIGGQDSSYLNRELVYSKKPLAQSVSVYSETLQKSGALLVQADLYPSVSIHAFRKRVQSLLNPNICNREITEREVQKAKNLYLIDFYRGLEENSGRAHMLGVYEQMFGDYKAYQKNLDDYLALTLEEVRSICQKLFSSSEITLSIWNKN